MPPCTRNARRADRRGVLPFALSVLAALAALGAMLAACGEAVGPGVESTAPTPAQPGQALSIRGRGFGAAPQAGDQIALAGRPLAVEAWTSDHLVAHVPADQPAGEALLVVRAQGRPLPAVGVLVGGRTPYPPGPDAGPAPPADGGPSPDARAGADADGATDARLPDALLEDARAEFTPDPAVAGSLSLEAAGGGAGLISIRVVRHGAPWGVAFHLTWDPNLLAFVDASPASTSDGPSPCVWREIEPGRLAVGAVPTTDTVLTARFAIVGTGEGRVDMPARFASARDGANRPLAGWTFTGGTVRAVLEGP